MTALIDQKRLIIFVVAARGTLISSQTEITKLMPANYLIYLSLLRTKRNLVRGDFD